MQPTPGDLYSIAEAASAARVHPDTVRNWACKGIIRVWGHRGAYRVSLAEVLPPVSPEALKGWQKRFKPGPLKGSKYKPRGKGNMDEGTDGT